MMGQSEDSRIASDAVVLPSRTDHDAVDEHPSQCDGSKPWLGPFRFRVDYEGFKGIYHAEDDGYSRRLAMVLVVAGSVFAVGSVLELIDPERFGEGGALSFEDVFFCLLFIAVWLVALWFVVCPPLTTSKEQAVRFFRYHGRRVAKREVVEYESAVVSVSLGRLGGEEITDDGGLVRTPYAFLRRPVVSHGFLFAGVRNFRHDSLAYNMIGVNWAYRPQWDGSGVFIPVSCLGGRCGAWRARFRLARRVGPARRRYRRAMLWARLGRFWPGALGRARALMAPELEWTGELDANGHTKPKTDRT